MPVSTTREETRNVNLVRVIWSNTEGFHILGVRDEESKEAYSCLGIITDPQLGESLKVTGKFEDNSKFGKQFKFTSFQRIMPATTAGILHYITTIARWVGVRVGKKIIEAYGEDSLRVLKEDPDRVAAEIKGITPARAAEIAETLSRNEKEEAVYLQMGELCSGKISDFLIKKAVREWDDPVGKVREDPYCLMRLPGCGFPSADRVAAGMGIIGPDPRRMGAAMVSVLQAAAGRDGHTVIPNEYEFMAEVAKLTGIAEISDEAKNNADGRGAIVGAKSYLKSYHEAERSISADIRRITTYAKEYPKLRIATDDWADDQRAAIDILVNSPVCLLVGAPGTGKTWTLGQFVRAIGCLGLRIALAAPTGKAAKRISESMDGTGLTAITIHRLLEPTATPGGDDFVFSRCSTYPMDCQLLIVDETSMLDVRLAAKLLDAVPSGCRVIFVGDPHQLPSVGAGSVLRDLIESKAVPTATLTEIKRNKGEIVTGCHAIMKGKLKLPASSPLSVATGHNWRHLELDEPAEIIAQVVTLATEWATGRGIALKDLIVISPFNHRNKRDMSCQDFNIRLQEFRNPPAAGKTEMSGGIRIGDRVVRLANKVYKDAISGLDVPVVNGDLGMVENITGDHLTVLFESPERRIEMKRGEAELALAYALTCHKMQGSEARLVILPVHKSFGPFPNREWIYTAMSRAKELLVTVGQADALDYWVSRTGIGLRKTNLKKFMAGKDGAK